MDRKKLEGVRQWSGLIMIILLSVILFLGIFQRDKVPQWLRYEWVEIIPAFLLAIIAGLATEYIFRRYSTKSRFSKTTMVVKPRKMLARLTLPDGKHLNISKYNRVFGREDFLGLLVHEKLLYIGKEHFKMTRMDDGFYIEDLDTKNGTWVNGENIKGLRKIKLRHHDEIDVAHALTIEYQEEDKI
ncbi:MAG: FHA domain-containing protein [Methanobacteriaceae archaeon]|nr:FHA domain-containing protein [Methanobacteriaceae archaeon]